MFRMKSGGSEDLILAQSADFSVKGIDYIELVLCQTASLTVAEGVVSFAKALSRE